MTDRALHRTLPQQSSPPARDSITIKLPPLSESEKAELTKRGAQALADIGPVQKLWAGFRDTLNANLAALREAQERAGPIDSQSGTMLGINRAITELEQEKKKIERILETFLPAFERERNGSDPIRAANLDKAVRQLTGKDLAQWKKDLPQQAAFSTDYAKSVLGLHEKMSMLTSIGISAYASVPFALLLGPAAAGVAGGGVVAGLTDLSMQLPNALLGRQNGVSWEKVAEATILGALFGGAFKGVQGLTAAVGNSEALRAALPLIRTKIGEMAQFLSKRGEELVTKLKGCSSVSSAQAIAHELRDFFSTLNAQAKEFGTQLKNSLNVAEFCPEFAGGGGGPRIEAEFPPGYRPGRPGKPQPPPSDPMQSAGSQPGPSKPGLPGSQPPPAPARPAVKPTAAPLPEKPTFTEGWNSSHFRTASQEEAFRNGADAAQKLEVNNADRLREMLGDLTGDSASPAAHVRTARNALEFGNGVRNPDASKEDICLSAEAARTIREKIKDGLKRVFRTRMPEEQAERQVSALLKYSLEGIQVKSNARQVIDHMENLLKFVESTGKSVQFSPVVVGELPKEPAALSRMLTDLQRVGFCLPDDVAARLNASSPGLTDQLKNVFQQGIAKLRSFTAASEEELRAAMRALKTGKTFDEKEEWQKLCRMARGAEPTLEEFRKFLAKKCREELAPGLEAIREKISGVLKMVH